MTKTCQTCVHYFEREFDALCRRNPPVDDYRWPKVLKGDSCSFHETGKKQARAEKVNIPTTEAAQRIAHLFDRRFTTPWSDKEIAAFKKAKPQVSDFEVIVRYYAQERAKPDNKGIHRRDLLTFLNNYAGELDRARARFPQKSTTKTQEPEGWREWLKAKGYDDVEYSKARSYMRDEFNDDKKKIEKSC